MRRCSHLMMLIHLFCVSNIRSGVCILTLSTVKICDISCWTVYKGVLRALRAKTVLHHVGSLCLECYCLGSYSLWRRTKLLDRLKIMMIARSLHSLVSCLILKLWSILVKLSIMAS